MRASHARAAAVLGLAGVAISAAVAAGGRAAVFGGLAALAVVSGRLVARPPSQRALSAWRAANALALTGAVAAGALGAPVIEVGVALVCWLLAHRAWTGQRASDDRVTLLLSLLLLLLACILTISAALAPLFAAFALLAPAALALTHLGTEEEGGLARALPAPREATPSLLPLGLASVVLSVAFFIAIPRTARPGGLLGVERTLSVAGYGDELVVGEGGAILDNPEVVLRVRFGADAGVGPWYLRGSTLDTFDGARWTRTTTTPARFRPRTVPEGALQQEILQEPLPEPVIFGVPDVLSVSGLDEPPGLDAGGGLRLAGPPRRLSYTVWSAPRPRAERALAEPDTRLRRRTKLEVDAETRGLWTALPEDLDPAIPAFAARVVEEAAAGTSASGRALALERWLRREFAYTDAPEPALLEQSLSEFLLQNRRGHCEYFASTLAVLLRSQGIPARVVTGFLGGEWNALGDYLVLRQRDAHAWVEADLGGGWYTLDGTPVGEALPEPSSRLTAAWDWARSGWTRLILEYDLYDQLAFVGALGGPGQGVSTPSGGGRALLVLGAVVGLGFGLRLGLSALAGERRGRRRLGRVEALHAAARRKVARKGWEIPASLPPVEAAEWLGARAGEPARPLLEIAWSLYRVRYGGEDDRALSGPASEALQALDALGRP